MFPQFHTYYKGLSQDKKDPYDNKCFKEHFEDDVAVEEKMNGYNVRIASLDGDIVAFTRGGYVCPFTTKKAPQILDLNDFSMIIHRLVICGEMVGTDNPYVSHYYPEIGKLGFKIFDIREKVFQPTPVHTEKTADTEKIWAATSETFRNLSCGRSPLHNTGTGEETGTGSAGRSGNKGSSEMKIPPLKYTSSQAQASELEYAFSFPFDLGKAFLFSRVIREGFQAHEMQESEDELKKEHKDW